jgi:hypothetical protein
MFKVQGLVPSFIVPRVNKVGCAWRTAENGAHGAPYRADNSIDDHSIAMRPAGMDCRHPGPQDAFGVIHVNWVPALHAGTTE